MAERLTIDTMVFRDYIEANRPGHKNACLLFDLASSGAVELAVASSGYAIDVLRHQGQLAEQLRDMVDSGAVTLTAQLSYPGVMYPGPNAYPGAFVEGLREAWDSVLGDWPSHEGSKPHLADWLHVETHVLERRDVFLSNERACCNVPATS